MKQLWLVLLLLFISVNVYAISTSDLTGLWHYLKNLGPWGTLATVDLLIALFIAAVFVARHARQQSINPAPYLVLTVLTGSTGLLFYLVRFWQSDSDRKITTGMTHVRS